MSVLVALTASAVLAVVPMGGSDAPPPYDVGEVGITLPAGAVFRDGGHVNIKTNHGDRSIHFEALNNQPSGQWIGKSFLPWSAFGLDASTVCVKWVQISEYNEHFGEGSQKPVGAGCKPKPSTPPTPTPTPTSSPSSTPSATPSSTPSSTPTPSATVSSTPRPSATPSTPQTPVPSHTPTPTPAATTTPQSSEGTGPTTDASGTSTLAASGDELWPFVLGGGLLTIAAGVIVRRLRRAPR